MCREATTHEQFERKTAMTTKDLAGKVTEAENTLDALQESRRSGAQRLEQIEAERQQYVVAARSGKDSDAQKKLCQLNEDMQNVQRDLRDDEAAIAQTEATLSTLSTTLHLAKMQEYRASMVQMLESRIEQGLEKKATDLLQQLHDVTEAIHESDKKLGSALRAFNNATGEMKRHNQSLNATAVELADNSAAIRWLYAFKDLRLWDMTGKTKEALGRAVGEVKLARIPEKEQLQSQASE
jgi:chromosome segregation ATPase